MIKPLRAAYKRNRPELGFFSNHAHPMVRFIWEEIVARNVTLSSVANAAGVDPSTLHKWRKATRGPTIDQIESVLTVLGYEIKVEKAHG